MADLEWEDNLLFVHDLEFIDDPEELSYTLCKILKDFEGDRAALKDTLYGFYHMLLKKISDKYEGLQVVVAGDPGNKRALVFVKPNFKCDLCKYDFIIKNYTITLNEATFELKKLFDEEYEFDPLSYASQDIIDALLDIDDFYCGDLVDAELVKYDYDTGTYYQAVDDNEFNKYLQDNWETFADTYYDELSSMIYNEKEAYEEFVETFFNDIQYNDVEDKIKAFLNVSWEYEYCDFGIDNADFKYVDSRDFEGEIKK